MCVVAESFGGGASKALQIQLELPDGNGSIQREDMLCAFLYANYISQSFSTSGDFIATVV